MTTVACAACRHPLTASDRFCPGCGQGTVVETPLRACPRCNNTRIEGAFCSDCGQRLATSSARPATGFQWKWAALTVPIMIAATAVCLVAAAMILPALGVSEMPPAVILLAGALGMLTGGLVAGFLSPARTVFEPGVGIAATVVVLSLLTGDLAGSLIGWLIPFALGSLGAAIGEFLQRLRARDA